jgi:tetratricopeptide (TPR) repeat protein
MTDKNSETGAWGLLIMFIRFLTCAGCLYLALSSSAQTGAPVQSPRDQLSQWTKELQDKSENQTLRQKIIKVAATLEPLPAVSEDAKRHMARGKAAFEIAKNENDFGDAVSEFKLASLSAPWWGAVYFNLGRAQDKAGDYAAAKQSLNLYLLSAPSEADAEAAKSLIYEVEFKMEKKQAQASQEDAKQAEAVRNEQQQRARPQSVEGIWLGAGWKNGELKCLPDAQRYAISRESSGQLAVKRIYEANVYSMSTQSIVGRHVQFTELQNARKYGTIYTFKYDLTLSTDGMTLTGKWRYYFKGDLDHEDDFVLCRQE